ncbi:MAG: FeoA family protein [Parachlamydiales bacterium]|jgi:ferrous iron transport protein A
MDENTNLQKLFEFRAGNRVKISCISCGQTFKRRLMELGLFDGAEVEIIKNDNHGPLIIGIFNSKIALGRGEAAKILGQRINEA